MEKTFQLIGEEEKPIFPIKKLLKVQHKGNDLLVGYPSFRGNYLFNLLNNNRTKAYTHPLTGEEMYFREPTTSESISVCAILENLSEDNVLHTSYFQIGRIVKALGGVFVNPPKDKKGNIIIDERTLKSYLNKAEKINGIYIVPNQSFEKLKDFGFAPYGSFEQGIQSRENFAVNPKTNGLARVLEHTMDKFALNLKKISNNYSEIEITNFRPLTKSSISVLYDSGICSTNRLKISGWCGHGTFDPGSAFGVKE